MLGGGSTPLPGRAVPPVHPLTEPERREHRAAPTSATPSSMAAKRSTLFTSPVSFADFVFRLAFFAVAPFAIVVVAQLFPVRGALIDVGLALLVFVSSEAAHRLARRWRAVDLLISQALEFE